MFRFLMRGLRGFRKGKARRHSQENIEALHARVEGDHLSRDIQRNVSKIRKTLGHSSDLVVRELQVGTHTPVRLCILQIDGLVDKQYGSENILSALMYDIRSDTLEEGPSTLTLDLIYERALTIAQVKKEPRLKETLFALTGGDTVLLVNGSKEALICSTRGFEHRGVEEPVSETGVRVPREGFTEVLRVNTSMVRRRIRDPRLWFENMQIGSVTQTDVTIGYIKGIVNDKIVEEVRRRLKRIEIDGILESGYIEQFIEDSPYSLFPQVFRTERPDVIAADLLEGHVTIFTEGTPFALIVPVTLPKLLNVNEDYYERFWMATFLRMSRYGFFFISLTAPAFYIALTTFHHEMLPTPLLLNVAAAREGVPFPAVVEAFMMVLAFEMLREAGLRLPRIVGPAVTIVGALVLGEQAVQAGLVSPAMVIVVATMAIASFSNPSYSLDISARMLRFAFIGGAAVLGFFGVLFVSLFVLMHLCALRSFGVPYLSPYAPIVATDLKDSLVRVPLWAMFSRPRLVGFKEPVRQDFDNQPEPQDALDVEKGR